MKKFSELNITFDRFTGKKIDIDDVIDQDIEVLGFKIGPSKYPGKGNGMVLCLRIRFEGKERVIFTGSVILQEQCDKAQEMGAFPFVAKIEKLVPKGYKFI